MTMAVKSRKIPHMFEHLFYFKFVVILGSSIREILTRKDLYDIMKNCSENSFVKKMDFMENYILSDRTFPDEEKKNFKHKLSYIKSEFKKRWFASHKVESSFLKKNHNWLQNTIEIPCKKIRTGRPTKPFVQLSERSKRRKTQHLRERFQVTEVTYASQMMLRDSGNVEGSKVVKDITSSPTRGAKYRLALDGMRRRDSQEIIRLSPNQALSIFVEASLTRKQYEIIRTGAKKVYPCYSVIQEAKKQAYPVSESYHVTATCAEIQLQALLNHTSERLTTYLEEILGNFPYDDINSLELIYKWGCDGSQQVQFKQKFENSNDSDANIFQSSLVPLQLISRKNKDLIVWKNPTPSSPRYCRPIRIRFIRETSDVTNEEIGYINSQIQTLQETRISRTEGDLSIKHLLLMTMVDAKVCNASTDTASTLRCYICKATSKDFNDLSKIKEVNTESLTFGLSVLHARIRFFEFLLHLSYKINVKKWQIRSVEERKIVQERKKVIQEKFKNRLGLIVDVPKPGYGNSNDGNTSRRFFADHETSAEITGVDMQLIYRFKVILEAISSGFKIDIGKFSAYTLETARMYVDLYPWYPMSPTVHKILVHGPTVIEHALLPIGSLSEEAAEARNKHFRLYRQSFARKFSREACNLDILNRLLLTSDPLITGQRQTPRKSSKPFLADTLRLLLPSEEGIRQVRQAENEDEEVSTETDCSDE